MSKRAEAIRALRDMSDDELAEHLRQERRRLFELRFQQATGQVENHRLIRDTRREIARTMTVQIEIARGVVVPERVQPVAVAVAKPARRRRAAAETALVAPTAEEEPEPAEEPQVPAEAEPEPQVDERDTALSETEPSPEEVDPDE